ncbi:hypothetical protein BOX15_Mlig015896g1 [Macrostomum lignano]|uniref:Serine/threonine-protein phosphatase n=1 Tax=Macrostomum lignano TaxID=282301 RepID=A0A267FD73_9PLAT|nr:hypothetical protein BOX15_Mlig015896g3 [Macrostomum lignano]PAA71653.1 hypothetical protein BOX15_Mlig015896g1 [Macrostomum lignano]
MSKPKDSKQSDTGSTDTAVQRSIFEADLKQLALRLMSMNTSSSHNHVQLSSAECLTVCHLAVESMKTRDICLMLQSPLNVVADIHGQFHDLLRIFDSLGKPPDSKYLFLGDYVDRGKFSLEVIMLLFVQMLMHPNSVFLLRGNHETASVCCRYGFRAEIQQRFSKIQANQVLSGFIRAFHWMPLCAIVDGRIICCHGGLSPSMMLKPFDTNGNRQLNLNALSSQLHRPLEPKRSGLAMDLLWADPNPGSTMVYFSNSNEMKEAKWVHSARRQCSFLFSGAALQQVLRMFRVKLLVRGHQMAQAGFRVSLDRRCITLFSAPGYCGIQTNSGGVLQIIQSSKEAREAGTFFVMKPSKWEQSDLEQLFWTDMTEGPGG